MAVGEDLAAQVGASQLLELLRLHRRHDLLDLGLRQRVTKGTLGQPLRALDRLDLEAQLFGNGGVDGLH
ncbi:hypothetical protein D9M70_602230 [compost metagenome]